TIKKKTRTQRNSVDNFERTSTNRKIIAKEVTRKRRELLNKGKDHQPWNNNLAQDSRSMR
ncbi:18008_t:CDS:1, partial [Entrophospora sp. SA101]